MHFQLFSSKHLRPLESVFFAIRAPRSPGTKNPPLGRVGHRAACSSVRQRTACFRDSDALNETRFIVGTSIVSPGAGLGALRAASSLSLNVSLFVRRITCECPKPTRIASDHTS